jgi:hypothetical protein
MEAIGLSETLVTIYKTIQHHKPEDHILNFFRREDLKYETEIAVFMSPPYVHCSQS